jgi:hypothetical protein
MTSRRTVFIVLAGIFPALGASYPTTNFVVYAPNAQIAQKVGQAAEHYRRQKAIQWLGHEMPNWPQRCPITVKVTMNGPGGATSFVFDQGRVLKQNMEIEGPLDRLLASVLPHEITHTVFAYYFGCPVPRWADEGGSVLSEDEPEKDRHDKLVRQILNHNQAIPARSLFGLRDYPRNVMCLYAEGFSISNYLVSTSDRPTFLKFVAHGMRYGWDSAAKTYYRHNSVEELEEAWLAELRRTKGQPLSTLVASNNTGAATATPTGRTVVRLTAPPVQPLEEAERQPIYRGRAASSERGEGRFREDGRPAYLPDYVPSSGNARPVRTPLPADGWQPAGQARPYTPAPVKLGRPIAIDDSETLQPKPTTGKPAAQNISPVGYPQ